MHSKILNKSYYNGGDYKMTLTRDDQLKLLHDLLDEHISHHSGHISEYQQIKRLVQSLTAKDKVTDDQLSQVLPEIYNYGLEGENAQNLPEHITTNVSNIESWINTIQETTLE